MSSVEDCKRIASYNLSLVNDAKENVENTIKNINAELNYTFENKGLNGLTKGKEIDEDSDFIVPYYDSEGKPYFFINQYNPIFNGIITNSNNQTMNGGCGYASLTNAFINAFEVHSLVDSIGILAAFIKAGNGSVPSGSAFSKYLRGNNTTFDEDNLAYSFIKKYIYDENGNLKCLNNSTGDMSKFFDDFNSQESYEGMYSFYSKEGYSVKKIDQIIQKIENEGYNISITIASNFGAGGTIFGGVSGGHYSCLNYSTDKNIRVIDSFGNRTFQYERDNKGLSEGLQWTKSNLGFNEKNADYTKIKKPENSPKAPIANEETFWHETSEVIGSSYSTFEEFSKASGMNGFDNVFIVKISKK